MKKCGNYKITKISVNSHEQVDYLEINHEEVPVADGKIEKNKVATVSTITGEIEPSSGYGAMDKVTYTIDTAPKITKKTPGESSVDYEDVSPAVVKFADLPTAFNKWAIIDDTESAILDADTIGTDLTVAFADIVSEDDKIIVCWGYPTSASTASAIKSGCYYQAEIENPKPAA